MYGISTAFFLIGLHSSFEFAASRWIRHGCFSIRLFTRLNTTRQPLLQRPLRLRLRSGRQTGVYSPTKGLLPDCINAQSVRSVKSTTRNIMPVGYRTHVEMERDLCSPAILRGHFYRHLASVRLTPIGASHNPSYRFGRNFSHYRE